MIDTKFFPILIRLDGKDWYLIWYSSDDQDGFKLKTSRTIATFSTISSLESCAALEHLPLESCEPEFFNLDALEILVESLNESQSCQSLLDAWNLLNDARSSIRGKTVRVDKKHKSLYQKLFWSCNLPSMTPEGEAFEPEWSTMERHSLRAILDNGLQFLRKHLQLIAIE